MTLTAKFPQLMQVAEQNLLLTVGGLFVVAAFDSNESELAAIASCLTLELWVCRRFAIVSVRVQICKSVP